MTKRVRPTWNSALFQMALTKGTVDQVREQLDAEGANPNQLYENDCPAIFLAAISPVDALSKVLVLREHGALIRVQNGVGESLIQFCARHTTDTTIIWWAMESGNGPIAEPTQGAAQILERYVETRNLVWWMLFSKMLSSVNMAGATISDTKLNMELPLFYYASMYLSADFVSHLVDHPAFARDVNLEWDCGAYKSTLEFVARHRRDAECERVICVLISLPDKSIDAHKRAVTHAYQACNAFAFRALFKTRGVTSSALNHAFIWKEAQDYDPMPMFRLLSMDQIKRLWHNQVPRDMSDKLFWAFARVLDTNVDLWSIHRDNERRWFYTAKDASVHYDGLHMAVAGGDLDCVKGVAKALFSPFKRDANGKTLLLCLPPDNPGMRDFVLTYQEWKPRPQCMWWWGPYFIDASKALLGGIRRLNVQVSPDIRKLLIWHLSKVWKP